MSRGDFILGKDQTTPKSEYLSIKEVARKIGFNYFTVYEWTRTRGLPVRRSCKRGRMTVYWPEFLRWWKELRND